MFTMSYGDGVRAAMGNGPAHLGHTDVDVDATRGNRRCASSAEAPWKHSRERMTTTAGGQAVGHVPILVHFQWAEGTDMA